MVEEPAQYITVYYRGNIFSKFSANFEAFDSEFKANMREMFSSTIPWTIDKCTILSANIEYQ